MENSKDEIYLMDALKIAFKRRKLILSISLLIPLVTGLISFAIPNSYTATTTLIPIEKSNSPNFSSLLGAMGGGLGALALESGLTSSSAGDRFVTILNSRTLTEDIIKKLDLLPIIFSSAWDQKNLSWKKSWLNPNGTPPTMSDAVEETKKIVKLQSDKKKNLVVIKATTNDPTLSALIANTYVQALTLYLQENTLTNAKRNRLFVEEQLTKTREEMATLEVAAKNFQQKNKVVSLDAQAEAAVRAYSDVKSKLMATEIELSLLKKGAFGEDPRIPLKRQEIDELKKQLAKLESNSETGPMLSFQQAPSLRLDFSRIKRDLMTREKILELLTQQHELAKIEEAQEDISFQTLDTAIPPEKKSGPKRLLIVLAACIVGVASGVVAAFTSEFWSSHRETLTT